MITTKIVGNLVTLGMEGTFDVIVHGCNTLNCFGAGIALEIKNKLKPAYEADTLAHKQKKNSLGNISIAEILLDKHQLTVINMYTQSELGWNYQHDCPPCDYTAIYRSFLKLNSMYKDSNFKIGIPYIGAGLAKGDWDIIKALIDLATPDIDFTLVEFKK